MSEISRRVAVIPAKSCSAGIPNKNFRRLHGKPLFMHTVEQALAAHVFSDVVLVLDDSGYTLIDVDALESGGVTVIVRPAHLSNPEVHAIFVVFYVIQHLELGVEDAVAMLLPTSPFRTPRTIREGMTALLTQKVEAVVGVTKTTWRANNLRVISDDGRLEFLTQSIDTIAQRQSEPQVYGVNGSFFAALVPTIVRSRTFHVSGAMPLITPSHEALDLNTLDDWAEAESRVREVH